MGNTTDFDFGFFSDPKFTTLPGEPYVADEPTTDAPYRDLSELDAHLNQLTACSRRLEYLMQLSKPTPYTVHTEGMVVYELFNFITSLIRKIYQAIVDTAKWIVKQFRPSTHYKAMLEKRRDTILRNLSLVNEKAWEQSEMYIEKYSDMRNKLDSAGIVIGLTRTMLVDFRSLQDDMSFALIKEMTPHLKVLGFYVDQDTKKVIRMSEVPEIPHKRLSDLGWSLAKVKDSVNDVIRLADNQSLFKEMEKTLNKLKKDTQAIEKRMSKASDKKAVMDSMDAQRIQTINKYVVFFATLSKAIIGTSHNISFKYINLCDKMKTLSVG